VGEQRKLVTVLFADVVDFTVLSQELDAEDVRDVVNAYFTCWHRILEANGGVVEKFIGDAVMAVFGLQPSHEDDPQRAIRAALQMTEALGDLNASLASQYGITLAMRIGIDTGDVVVGTLDDRPDHGMVVVGETVNRAARLQSAAPHGGVLISTDTFRHVRGVFGVEPVEGLALKGIAQPVNAYLVVSERPQGFRLDGPRGVEGVETRTVGREVELQRLQNIFWDVVDDGGWRVVTVLGDAGVGKSRLLVEFDRWVAELPESAWWFRGRASPSAQDSPNALLRDVIASRLEIQESDGPDVVREKWRVGFERVLGPGEVAERKAQIIAQWLGFDIGDDVVLGGPVPSSQSLRDRAIAHTAECFQLLAAESPVVVLLEDLHWSDEGSLAWIDAADPFLHASPVLVVASARTSLLERHPHWGEGLEHHVRLPLPSLSRRESRQLVAEILQRVDHVPNALRDLVVTAADGNPFYIEELVKWLLEAGVITKETDGWRVHEDRIESARVPPTLKGVLQARLDSLAPDEQLALQRAAVVGRVFWDDAVESLRDHAVADEAMGVPTSQSLDQLRAREVVYEREGSAFDDTREFSFKHALLRDVTYDSLLKVHRRAYHGLAARWLAQMAARTRREDLYAGVIAGHHDDAGEGQAAGYWYLKAGRQAASVHALADATRLLGRGLEVVDAGEHALRFDLLVAREDVLERLGDRPAQRADLAAMDQLEPWLEDAGRKVQLLLCRCRSEFNDSDYVRQAASARQAVALADEAGLAAAEVEARLWLGKALAWHGDHVEARGVLELTLARARSSGHLRLVGETLRYLALVALNQSELAAAVALLEEALVVDREQDQPEEEGAALVQLASVYYNQGRYSEAKVILERALPIFVASGYKYRQAIVTCNLASIASVQGELGAARRLVVDGLRLSVDVGDKESTGLALGSLGDIWRRAGDLEQAEALLQQSVDAATEIDFDFLLSDSLVGLVLVADERGRPDDAERLADLAVAAARRAQAPLVEARALVAQGSVLVRAGRRSADMSLQAAADLGGSVGVPAVVLEAKAWLALSALQGGDDAGALEIVERLLDHLAVADVEGCSRPGEVYLCCWRVLSACRDARAAEVLIAAGSYLDEMGARIDEADLREGFLTRVRAHVELAQLRAGPEPRRR
jgi:class 3 adenylate cyclase/tetratricopeptide (TPR) repeat protein